MISQEELENLAHLARIKLTEKEAEKLREDISSILGYVDQISAVSTVDIIPEAPTHRNIFREDEPRKEGSAFADKREAVIKAFPGRQGDYGVVPKILQKDE